MFEQLKSDILGVLRCKDNFMTTKIYNADGNITVKPEEIAWVYVPNREMIFTMPTEENQKLVVGKNDLDFDDALKHALQQMRKICNLNGVPLVVRKYSAIDKRKVFNIVKQNVFESVAATIATEMQSLQTYKTINSYLPLEAQISRSKCLVETACDTLAKLSVKHADKLHEIIVGLFESANKNYAEQIKALPNPNKKLMSENLNNIKNVFAYVKNQNSLYAVKETKYPIRAINEWAKIMEIDSLPMMSNLEAAVQKLFLVSEGCKDRVDLLRIIRDNKICEDYLVSKDALLEAWLTKTPVKAEKSYLIETTDGTEIMIPARYSMALNKIVKMVSESKGKYDTLNTDVIIQENQRCLDLADFAKKYVKLAEAKKFVPTAIRLCENAVKFFDTVSMDIEPHLSSSDDRLYEVSSIKNHPAYSEVLAVYECEQEKVKQNILNEHKREKRILVNEFTKYVGEKHAVTLAESILGGHISLLGECNNSSCKDFLKSLKKNAYTLDPVIRKCFDNYLACKSYQSEDRLKKIPALEIFKAYIK